MLKFVSLSPLLVVFIFLVSCSAKKAVYSDKTTPGNNSKITSVCDRPVKYHSSRIRVIASGETMEGETEILIDPKTKIINLFYHSSSEGSKSFDTNIESSDCSLNNDLSMGKAVYHGYILRQDGSKTISTIVVEPYEGGWVIKGSHDNHEPELMILVDKWEITEAQ